MENEWKCPKCGVVVYFGRGITLEQVKKNHKCIKAVKEEVEARMEGSFQRKEKEHFK